MGIAVWLLVAVRLGLGSADGQAFPDKATCMRAAESRIDAMVKEAYSKGGSGVNEPFAYFCTEGLRMPTSDEIVVKLKRN